MSLTGFARLINNYATNNGIPGGSALAGANSKLPDIQGFGPPASAPSNTGGFAPGTMITNKDVPGGGQTAVPRQGQAGGPASGPTTTASKTAGFTPYWQTAQPDAFNSMAQNRTGFTEEAAPSLDSLSSSFVTPDISKIQSSADLTGLGANPYMTSALNSMQGLGMNDFGIPADVREKMKVQDAATLSPQYEAQKQAAKRAAVKLGLVGDQGTDRTLAGIDMAKNAALGKEYNDIDIQSGLQANQQRLQNYQNLIAGGSAVAQANQNREGAQEQSRQFNVGAGLDTAHLSAADAQAQEQMRLNRATMLESVRNFLEDYELRRIRQASGLVDAADSSAAARNKEAQNSFFLPMSFGSSLGSMYGSQ